MTPPANVTATTTPLLLQTPSPAWPPSPALLASRDVWLAAPAEPPPSCMVSAGESISTVHAAFAIPLGPVQLRAGSMNGKIDVDLTYPAHKVLIIVDQSAGTSVTIEGRQRETATPLLFYYRTFGQQGETTGDSNVPADEYGVSSLVLVGPFSTQRDAARGYFFAGEPGCYDVTALWDGGTATATLYFAALPGT